VSAPISKRGIITKLIINILTVSSFFLILLITISAYSSDTNNIVDLMNREKYYSVDVNNDGSMERIYMERYSGAEKGLKKIVILGSDDNVLLYMNVTNIFNLFISKNELVAKIYDLEKILDNTKNDYLNWDEKKKQMPEPKIRIKMDDGTEIDIRKIDWLESVLKKNDIEAISRPLDSGNYYINDFENLLYKYWKYLYIFENIGSQRSVRWNKKPIKMYFKANVGKDSKNQINIYLDFYNYSNINIGLYENIVGISWNSLVSSFIVVTKPN
jgi:hypothetical protein